MTGKNDLVRYEFIDALRGLAFLGVLMHHVGNRIEGLSPKIGLVLGEGHEGVELFFLCSAMTLFLSFASRSRAEERPIVNYLIRRFFRIAPLFYSGAVFYYFVAGFRGISGGSSAFSWGCILSTLSFTNGWSVPWINKLVPGGWSIAVEMNFYLLVPWLYRRITTKEKAVWATVGTLIFAALASAAARFFLARWLGASESVGLFSWYWLPMHLPIFCMGFVLYFLVRSSLEQRATGLAPNRSLANMLLVISGYLMISLCYSTPAFLLGHVLFGVAFVLLGWSLAINPNVLIVNRATRAIGLVSFSAYLCHFFALDLASNALHALPTSVLAALRPTGQLVLLTMSTLALTLAASTMTYRWIEIPGQKLGKALIKRLGTTRPNATVDLLPVEDADKNSQPSTPLQTDLAGAGISD